MMRYYILCAVLMVLAVGIRAQNNIASTITGKVYRFGTDSIIAGASVYYGGSMAGTSTNKNGEFTLTARQQQIPIIVSCTGYYSVTESKYELGHPLIIYLKPKAQELHEVVIRADGMNRKEEIREFIREFLGTSAYARSCTITNIDDINFYYSKKTQTLTASCDKPIIVINNKLGYTINYYLDKFELKGKDIFIAGNSIFKEIPELAGQAKIKRNREDAYEGSRMQFIRALWHGAVRKAGFRMYIGDYVPLKENNIIAHDSLQQKYIHLPGNMLIINTNDARGVNSLRANAGLVYIDKDGYYGTGLLWAGLFSSQRMGDLLPFEYKFDKEQKDFTATEETVARLIASNKANNNPSDSSKNKIAMPDALVKYKTVFEKTYLHTDRDVYAPGDTLWFKAYLLNAQDNKPTVSSANLYVELISPDSKIINSELIRLENGLGNGDFDLADALAPGKYRLLAYTNWMRNFGDNFIFEKEITVLSSSGEVAVAGNKAARKGVAVAGKNKKLIAASATPTVTKTSVNAILPLIRFYPEGGSLVEGISSLIAVKADDGFGSGLAAAGVVLTAAGDTISRFSCDSLGMGLFALLPVKGQVYHALVKFSTNSHETAFDLPSALSKGLAMQLKQTDSLIRVVVSSSNDYSALSIKPTFTLTVKQAGITLFTQPLQLKSNQISVKIPTANFPEGIVAITLYDDAGKPNCERLVYIHQQKTNEKVSINTDKQTYQPKERVTVSINAAANSNLSLAVVDAGIVPEQVEDIISYLKLQSELKGNIEHARHYFDTTNTNRFKQLDLLLLTQGWCDFVWRRLADTAIRISYAAENSINVSGNVRDEVNNKRMPGLNLNLYANDAIGNKIFAAKSDSSGKFNFTDIMLYGKQNIKFSSVNDKGEKRGSFQIDSVIPMPIKPIILKVVKEVAADSVLITAIQKRKDVIKKATKNGITHLKELKIKGKGGGILLRNGGAMQTWGPDQVFNIAPNDESLMTLEAYLQYYTKGAVKPLNDPNKLIYPIPPPQRLVSSEKYNLEMRLYLRHLTGVAYMGVDTFAYTVFNLGTSSPIRYRPKPKPIPPYLIVNGRELDMDSDYDQAEAYRSLYFNMPISKFKKIVLSRVAGTLHGPLNHELQEAMSKSTIDAAAESIVVDRFLLYLTMKDDAMTDNPGSLSIDVPGYYQARTFYQPPPNAKPQLADYRSTIHWEPNIKTDANGKANISFYNAVPQADIRVIVQGITDKGLPVSATAGYGVK